MEKVAKKGNTRYEN